MGGPLRLLPWPGDDGKASFLVSGGGDGFLSRLADRVEARQLDMAEDLLDHVSGILSGDSPPETEWHNLVTGLSVALRDAVRIAQSRGDRLPRTGDDEALAAKVVTDVDSTS